LSKENRPVQQTELTKPANPIKQNKSREFFVE
jgi:hypothetical protein